MAHWGRNCTSKPPSGFNDLMAIREFIDSAGGLWRIWSTLPSNPNVVTPELRDGWLTFDSGGSRRRLVPIPVGWEALPDPRMELLLKVATSIRTSDPFGTVALSGADADEGESVSG
jgi:hypothetical protein